MSQKFERTPPARGRFRIRHLITRHRLLLPASGRLLFAAGLLLVCTSIASAALIEISLAPSDRKQATGRERPLPFRQDQSRHHRLNGYGFLPAVTDALGRQTYGTTYRRNVGVHVLHTVDGSPMPNSDLYAAIDAPYGVIDSSVPSGDTDPELWTILLVATGLIGYQIRRKSRISAVRIRPLQL